MPKVKPSHIEGAGELSLAELNLVAGGDEGVLRGTPSNPDKRYLSVPNGSGGSTYIDVSSAYSATATTSSGIAFSATAK